MITVQRPSVLPSGDFRRDIIALIPYLRAFARSICKRGDMGDDLAQETLIKAWKSQANFQPGTNLKAWLFTILRNEYYSQQRRNWRQSHWDEIKAERIATPPEPQYWSQTLSDTSQALRELPDTQREALILVGAGGFSYEEAAEICQAPIGTIKSRVARGRVSLIQMLDGEQKMPRRSQRAALAPDDILMQLATLTPSPLTRSSVLPTTAHV